MANKDDGKSAAAPVAPVSYAGDPIQKKLLWIGLILLGVGYFSTDQNRSSGSGAGDSGLAMCDGLKKPVLTREASPVRQTVLDDCFSVVLIPPSSARHKVAVNSPGMIEFCYWRNNRCIAWLKTKDGQIQEKVRGEIPNDYSAILMRGDPGTAEIHLLR